MLLSSPGPSDPFLEALFPLESRILAKLSLLLSDSAFTVPAVGASSSACPFPWPTSLSFYGKPRVMPFPSASLLRPSMCICPAVPQELHNHISDCHPVPSLSMSHSSVNLEAVKTDLIISQIVPYGLHPQTRSSLCTHTPEGCHYAHTWARCSHLWLLPTPHCLMVPVSEAWPINLILSLIHI